MRLSGLGVVLALSLTLAPLVLAAPTDPPELYTEEASSFPSGDVTLRAVLGRPYGDGHFPAYVHVHGSATPEEANTPPWKGLVEGSYLHNHWLVRLEARSNSTLSMFQNPYF